MLRLDLGVLASQNSLDTLECFAAEQRYTFACYLDVSVFQRLDRRGAPPWAGSANGEGCADGSSFRGEYGLAEFDLFHQEPP